MTMMMYDLNGAKGNGRIAYHPAIPSAGTVAKITRVIFQELQHPMNPCQDSTLQLSHGPYQLSSIMSSPPKGDKAGSISRLERKIGVQEPTLKTQ